MTNPITCLACSHSADAGKGPSFADGIFVCGECGARMAYGELAPRIVVEPCRMRGGFQGLRFRIQDPVTKGDEKVIDIDMPHGSMLAKNILSLVLP